MVASLVSLNLMTIEKVLFWELFLNLRTCMPQSNLSIIYSLTFSLDFFLWTIITFFNEIFYTYENAENTRTYYLCIHHLVLSSLCILWLLIRIFKKWNSTDTVRAHCLSVLSPILLLLSFPFLTGQSFFWIWYLSFAWLCLCEMCNSFKQCMIWHVLNFMWMYRFAACFNV